MEKASYYRDLLWDFSYEGSSKKSEITLRVFGNEQEMFDSYRSRTVPGDQIDLNKYWLSPYSRSQSVQRNICPAVGEMEEQGRMLWEAIPYWSKSPVLEATPDKPCRLKISSNSPAIDDLPWEWLNDGTGKPFALRPEIRIMRSVPVRLAVPPVSIEPPLRVLLILTNPKDEKLLVGYLEIDAVRSQIKDPYYDLRILDEPTVDALSEALKFEPHIIHYIGHAGVSLGEGNLILHDYNNRTYWINVAELERLLPLSVKLLCLSTCFTARNYQILGLPRLAHASVSYGLPTTVTNRYPVEGPGVSKFWEVFYRSLGLHKGNVNEAFHEAQQSVAETFGMKADWGSFSLVIRDQTAEVIIIEEGKAHSKEKFAAEIQAHLASSLANDLAESLRGFSTEKGEIVREQFEVTAKRVSDLIEQSRKEEK